MLEKPTLWMRLLPVGSHTFRHAGLSPADTSETGMLKAQLDHFYNSLELQGMANPGSDPRFVESQIVICTERAPV